MSTDRAAGGGWETQRDSGESAKTMIVFSQRCCCSDGIGLVPNCTVNGSGTERPESTHTRQNCLLRASPRSLSLRARSTEHGVDFLLSAPPRSLVPSPFALSLSVNGAHGAFWYWSLYVAHVVLLLRLLELLN